VNNTKIVSEFIDIFNAAVGSARESRQEEWENLHSENLFGASMVGGCLRASYMSRSEFPITNHFSAETMVVFDIGHQIESWFMDVVSEYVSQNGMGYIDPQAESKDNYHYAHTDGLWVTSEFAMPIEIKSISGDAVEFRERKGGKWTEYPHHALQICQFMYLSQKNGGYALPSGEKIPVVPFGIIFYIAKDGNVRISPVSLEDYRNELLSRMDDLEYAWNNKQIPNKQKSPDKYPCTFCRFWDLCWGTELPRTPKGSISFLKGIGIDVKRKDSLFYVDDVGMNNVELISFAASKNDEIRKR